MAAAFARAALANVSRAYPHKLDHLIVAGPEPWAADHVAVHPAFFGSYDWHSAVHMHWLLVRVLRLRPEVAEAAAIVALLDGRLTEPMMAAVQRRRGVPARPKAMSASLASARMKSRHPGSASNRASLASRVFVGGNVRVSAMARSLVAPGAATPPPVRKTYNLYEFAHMPAGIVSAPVFEPTRPR